MLANKSKHVFNSWGGRSSSALCTPSTATTPAHARARARVAQSSKQEPSFSGPAPERPETLQREVYRKLVDAGLSPDKAQSMVERAVQLGRSERESFRKELEELKQDAKQVRLACWFLTIALTYLALISFPEPFNSSYLGAAWRALVSALGG
jgi:hypothetical protein